MIRSPYLLSIPFLFCIAMACPAVFAASSTQVENKPWSTEIQAGNYTLDAYHASLIFHVDHLGFSHYTGSFSSFDAELELDPAKPKNAKLTATVDVSSLSIPTPPQGFLKELLGTQWFNIKQFPNMVYTSTSVEQTGESTALVHGDLTFLGKTVPVMLTVTYNGGYRGFDPYDPNARVGFSATGSLKRSDFGMAYGIPAEGTKMGVSDLVTFTIEAEFTGPPLPATATPKTTLKK